MTTKFKLGASSRAKNLVPPLAAMPGKFTVPLRWLAEILLKLEACPR